MTTSVPPARAPRVPPRATRSTDDRLLGGVAAGVAAHLGVDVMWVRVAFLLGAVFGGFGAALYAGLWMILPADTRFEESAPGLDAAGRQGKRPARARRLEDVGTLIALGAVAIGVAVLVQTWLGNGWLVWPVVIATVGVAVLWRQADEAQRERWADSTGRIDPVRMLVGSGGRSSWARLAAGVGLLAVAVTLFAVQTGSGGIAVDMLVAAGLGVVGVALVAGPWLFRLAGDLSEERAARIRQQERADLAAHLHDSVLQTLALIQKQADDGRAVATLARAQERDLRAWLYEEGGRPDETAAAGLRAAAAEVEDAHGVPVEVVVVGDVPHSDPTRAVVLAAREAMANAALHSGADRVDVYAELTPDHVEVFVRDRGAGFALEDVPDDRLGVRRSILDRMARHGGTADVRTAPGAGTEVRLRADLDHTEAPESASGTEEGR